MKGTYLLIGAFALSVVTGCQDSLVDTESSPTQAEQSSAVLSKVQFGGVIWSDGELFRTLGSPAVFSGDSGPFDILFTGASFKDGVGAISESKPGDADYNGGRWEVWALKEGVMTDYSNATSVEDLNMDDFESADFYFECPLRPARGKGVG